ncbi:MAG: 30S ribosomal protein S4 [Minisyncoccales bacterium]
MARQKCKICRRLGMKLFLKGERCFSPKCAMVRKPYPPGAKGKRRKAGLSEYGRQLREKQKLKKWYNLEEREFRNYVKKILAKRGSQIDIGVLLIETLERRLDNVIFRLGFASSRRAARQMVSHGYFLVNNRSTNIPSFLVKKGDKIKIKPNVIKKAIFQKISSLVKKHNPPSWLKLDTTNWETEVIGLPNYQEAVPSVDLLAIFEFYSK